MSDYILFGMLIVVSLIVFLLSAQWCVNKGKEIGKRVSQKNENASEENI